MSKRRHVGSLSNHEVSYRYGIIIVGILLMSLGFLSGCSNDEAESVDPVFVELIENAIKDAEAGGAGPEQIAVLEDAREIGEVTLDQIRGATRSAVDCFADLGYIAEYSEENTGGFILPVYSVGKVGDLSESDDLAIDRCDTEHDFWVSKVYQTQPATTQLRVEYVESKADELRACLEEAGYPPDSDATGVEMSQRAGALFGETEGKVDCLGQVGAW